MKYTRVITGTFIARPNRFIAKVEIDGKVETVHVKNTGRCREILIPGTKVVLFDSQNPERKTRYDLIAAYKGNILINIDSQAPNKAFQEFIPLCGVFGKDPKIYPEYTHGDSRFDFYMEDGERRCFAEVKGVTLENDGICSFPDAPTERGLKHLKGLVNAQKQGFEAYVVFIVQMRPVRYFTPNYATHAEFGEYLEHASENGVNILVYDCLVEPDSMTVNESVEYRFRTNP